MWVGRLFRRPAFFEALGFRIGIVFVTAAFPLVFLLGYWAPSQRGYTMVAFATMLGVFIAVAGLDLLVAAPLRRFGSGIDDWRSGKGFALQDIGNQPHEFRSVALSFKKATQRLQRREADLDRAIQRQELAMQEIHHRVKNNLQVVASLLNLQASRIRLPEAKSEFQAARDRVRALATVHRHLYAHGEINTINMRVFLTDLCGPLLQAMGQSGGQNGDDRIKLEVIAPELRMTSDQAVPLSLIVTEAVTNAIRYGFPDERSGTIGITLTCENEEVTLNIHDDGIGISAGRLETEEGVRDGIGIQLIRGFARQLGATLKMDDTDGTLYVLRMRLRHERTEVAALDGARHG